MALWRGESQSHDVRRPICPKRSFSGDGVDAKRREDAADLGRRVRATCLDMVRHSTRQSSLIRQCQARSRRSQGSSQEDSRMDAACQTDFEDGTAPCHKPFNRVTDAANAFGQDEPRSAGRCRRPQRRYVPTARWQLGALIAATACSRSCVATGTMAAKRRRIQF